MVKEQAPQLSEEQIIDEIIAGAESYSASFSEITKIKYGSKEIALSYAPTLQNANTWIYKFDWS